MSIIIYYFTEQYYISKSWWISKIKLHFKIYIIKFKILFKKIHYANSLINHHYYNDWSVYNVNDVDDIEDHRIY